MKKNQLRSAQLLLVAIILFILSACGDGEQRQGADEKTIESEGNMAKATIVAVGDSLTAGFGVNEEQAYPFLLEKKLQENGYNYRVINAGVSAETSSGTLSRIEWILTMDPEIVILETGANDGLRGISTDLVEKNLREMLNILQNRDVRVLLAGMRMVWNLGPVYVKRFNSIYPKLAEEYDLEFMPFFLEDVAMRSKLNLGDGVHPNSEGYKIIVENLYPHVVRVIESSSSE